MITDMKGNVVVTGGSGGIGLALAELFLKNGYRVFTLSRTAGKGTSEHILTDVTDEQSVKDAFKRIEDLCGHIDILVNNAGCGISGAIEYTPVCEAKRQFDVNFFGMFTCVKYAVPLLRKNGGRIVNVSSAAAIFSIPFQSFYSASKSAVNSLTLALRNELKQFGISVCAVMPGDVKTGFTDARVKHHDGNDVYSGMIDASVSVMEKDEKSGMTPEYVAKRIYGKAVKKHVRPLYTVGIVYKLYSLAERILPVSLVNWIVGKLYIKKS
ncbi:MAG: SDR family NAD(P)-dependent oxidoreductase [Christensenellaceae bacterium]|nr:SDR family NAD(P)-dependent oxidoreductase [Christensenellaceae bacterium]